MRIDLTDLSPVKKTMTVEVEPDEVRAESDGVLRAYRSKVKIPGFRPGKAPLGVVRARFAKELDEEVRERVLSRYFLAAAREKELKPLGDPAVEKLEHDDPEGPFRFTTTFEVLPAFELTGHRGVELRRDKPKVADADVDGALEEIRRSRTRLVVEEGREAQKGDVLFVDVHGAPNEGDPFVRERMPVELGAEQNLPEFNEHLQGARSGSEVQFGVSYPEDYNAAELAGREVAFRLIVHEVKRPELPELDDEFARDLGEFEDLAALRARVRQDLESRREHEERHAASQSVLDKVLLANPFVLPEVLVQGEMRHRLEEIARNMIMQGVDPEKADVNWADVQKQQEEPARKSVHARLVLDAVATAEGIEVSPKEIDDRIRREAERMGEPLPKVREMLRKEGGMESLMRQMLREKSLDYLTSVANIQYSE